MRFATSGKNWEGRGWFLAPGLVVLAEQIDAEWPDPEPGDGTVASKDHDKVSPTSDHRPFPYDAQTGAIVRALDAGETSETITQGIVNAMVASRDPRIMYIIYEGKSVWSIGHNGYPAWVWQPYLGPAPHDTHFHLSTKRTATADNDTRPWDIGVDMPLTEEDLAKIRALIVDVLGGDKVTWQVPGQNYKRSGNQGVLNSALWPIYDGRPIVRTIDEIHEMVEGLEN